MKNIIQRLANIGRYILLDPNDGSITLSKRLYKTICKAHRLPDDVFTFRRSDEKYAFIVNPYETVLNKYADVKDRSTSQLQYNGKHKCVGFAPDIPTVAQIVYDYNLPVDGVSKMSVTKETNEGVTQYIIEPWQI